MIHALAALPEVLDNGRVAEMFGMDPCDVAEEPDPRRKAYRLASYVALTS